MQSPPDEPLAITSTDRVRRFREERKKAGGGTLTVTLSDIGMAALDIVKEAGGHTYRVSALEAALIKEAEALCPTSAGTQHLVDSRAIAPKAAEAWARHLALKDEAQKSTKRNGA